MNFQTASRNRFNIQWWEVPVQQGYAPFPFVSSSFVGVLYTYFPLFLPLPTPSPRQLRTQFLFFLIPLNSSCFRKRDSLDEVQERETLSDSSRILYYRSTVIFYRYVNATEREREMLEREEGAFLLIRFTFRGRIVLHSTRFVSQSPFHSSTSWIIDFQGDTTRGLTLLKITVGPILGRRASLQRGNKDRLLLLLLSLFPLFAEKYAVASTNEFHREGYRLCYKFLISR